jgi:hypothetical protein
MTATAEHVDVDTEQAQFLAVVVHDDRGESPFGWSDPTPVHGAHR